MIFNIDININVNINVNINHLNLGGHLLLIEWLEFING